MNKSDLKKLIKPLVKECIHEVLLEEGLLSNVVSEVAKGLQGNLMVESAPVRSIPAAQAGSVDLGSPADAGVDISSLMGGATKIWKGMK